MKTMVFQKDLQNGENLTNYFSSIGECKLVTDGADVIDEFTEGYENGVPYDLICLDMMMPDLEGIRVLQAIRALEIIVGLKEARRIKSIIIAEENNMIYLESLINKDIDACLVNPYTEELIEDKVKELEIMN